MSSAAVEDSHGLFVYRAQQAVRVYHQAAAYEHAGWLQAGQVVSGTTISSGSLRLSDGKGWARVADMLRVEMDRSASSRLYRTRTGCSVMRRHHPDHESSFSDSTVSGLVTSSVRVKGKNGVWFVFLDGNPSCWLPETDAEGEPLLTLLEEGDVGLRDHAQLGDVCRGLRVYRVQGGAVPVYADCSRAGGPTAHLAPGTVVSTIVRWWSKDDVVVCLEDGSGWVFEGGEGEARLVPAVMQYGVAKYRITNGDTGLALRSRPDYDLQYRVVTTILHGTIEAYARVVGSKGDVFVRVEGKAGWLFETREGDSTLSRLPLGISQGSAYGGENELVTLASARDLALRQGWREIAFNAASRVVSFAKDGMRVNVYYTTGTVGTCLDHPRQGKTQLFRREVTLSELRQILANPRVHLNKGYKRREHMPQQGPAPVAALAIGYAVHLPRSAGGGAAAASGPPTALVGESVQSEEEAVREEMSRLEAEAVAAMEERQALAWQLEMIRAKRLVEAEDDRRQAIKRKQEEEAREENERRIRARQSLEAACAFPPRQYWRLEGCAHRHIEKALDGDVKDVAITATSYIVLYHGTTAWFDIPKGLDNKLRGRQAWLPKPVHVALGPEGTGYYCVIFSDGDWQATGPSGLYDALNCGGVSRVALGPNETYVVLYEDGRQAWSGGLPNGLYNQLNSRNPRLPKPIFVDLGPDGEWFVSYADGSYRWGGNSDETDEALAHAQAEGRVKRVLFGERDAYLIAYE